MTDDALNAAVLLVGPERGHAMIGCDWGTRVATPDDREVCTLQARQIVVLYNGDVARDVKVCLDHHNRLLAETDPHEGKPWTLPG